MQCLQHAYTVHTGVDYWITLLLFLASIKFLQFRRSGALNVRSKFRDILAIGQL